VASRPTFSVGDGRFRHMAKLNRAKMNRMMPDDDIIIGRGLLYNQALVQQHTSNNDARDLHAIEDFPGC
jgi:hypothetical protein